MSCDENVHFLSHPSAVVPLPSPAVPIRVRAGTLDDLPFIDALQKQFARSLGFFPRAQLEGYITSNWVLVAEDAVTGDRVGYVASRDRYLKRDELGVVYQLCVRPSMQRGLIGASLLKAAFDRSAYGCRLYCCWCAQDLTANRFWEAMGFTAIAFRGGSEKRGRVHIFWQRRIRSGDTATPWWFPAKTDGGAIREDRLVLPIPVGLAWNDAMPILKCAAARSTQSLSMKQKVLSTAKPPKKALLPPSVRQVATQFGPPGAVMMKAQSPGPPPREPQAKLKREAARCDPKVVAAARELRDRWLEELNTAPQQAIPGKYDVSRAGAAQVGLSTRRHAIIDGSALPSLRVA